MEGQRKHPSRGPAESRWGGLPAELAKVVLQSGGISHQSRAAARLVCRGWAAAAAAACIDLPGHRQGRGRPGWASRFFSLEALAWHGGDPPLQEVSGELERLSCLTQLKVLHPTDEQLWSGLEAVKQRLAALHLEHGASLTDAGVASLRRLTALESLTLRSAHLVTAASLELLWPLSSLGRICLTGTSIKDTELRALGRLPSLVSIRAGECSQASDDGVGAAASSLPRLEALELICCDRISDAGMAKLGAASSLTSLKISVACQVSDTGLAELRRLTRLADLQLSDAESLTGSGLSALQGLTRLARLQLSNCYELETESLSGVSALTGLEALDLAGSEIDSVPLRSLTRLTSLNLSSTRVSDECLYQLCGNSVLKKLCLGWCECLSPGGLEALLPEIASLETLDLSCVPAVNDSVLLALSRLSRLRDLDLKGSTGITDRGVRGSLAQMVSLKRLALSVPDGAAASSAIYAVSIGLSCLETLELKGEGISDGDLTSLQELASLTSLHFLDSPKLSDSGIMGLRTLPSLREVTIDMRFGDSGGVTDDGILALRREMPGCSVNIPVYLGV